MLKQYSTESLVNMLQNQDYNQQLVKSARLHSVYKTYSVAPKNIFLPMSEGLMGTSITLDIFWAIIYITNLSSLLMGVLVGTISILSVLLGSGMIWKNYESSHKRKNALNNKLESLLCLDAICKELTLRSQQKTIIKTRNFLRRLLEVSEQKDKKEQVAHLMSIDIPSLLANDKLLLEFSLDQTLHARLIQIFNNDKRYNLVSKRTKAQAKTAPELKEVDRRSKLIKACVAGISFTTLMFGSFFACGSYMLVGLGFLSAAAVLSNPITIGVAFLLAAGYGIFYGYKFYKDTLCQSKLKSVIRYGETACENRKREYFEAKSRSKEMKEADSLLMHISSDHSPAMPFFTESFRLKIGRSMPAGVCNTEKPNKCGLGF